MSGKYKIITPSGKVIEGTRPQVIADKAFAAETQDVHEGRHKRRAYDEGNRLVDRALAARQDVYVANAAVIEANDRFRELLDADEPSHDAARRLDAACNSFIARSNEAIAAFKRLLDVPREVLTAREDLAEFLERAPTLEAFEAALAELGV